MGIKNLNKFLREKCPMVFKPVHISRYSFAQVAIDISLYLHKFKAIAGDRWLSAFINLVVSLRRNHIHGVFIFDGKFPPEKREERTKRRERRLKLKKYIFHLEEGVSEYNKTSVVPEILLDLWKRRRSPKRLLGKSKIIDMKWIVEKVRQKKYQLIDIQSSDFTVVKELFDILKVPYLTAPWEAEKMCAKLCIDGLVTAVLSEDTDVIAYGAPIFLTKIDTSRDTAVAIHNTEVCSALNLTQGQLLDLCIMCGTDYNSNILRVGAHTAYKKLKQFKNIDGIKDNTTLDVSVLKYKRVRELFTEFADYKLKSIPYCGDPDYEKLQDFVIKHNIWCDTRQNTAQYFIRIKEKLRKLKDDFAISVIIFEGNDEKSK